MVDDGQMMVNNKLVGGFFATLLTIIGIILEYILFRMVNISGYYLIKVNDA